MVGQHKTPNIKLLNPAVHGAACLQFQASSDARQLSGSPRRPGVPLSMVAPTPPDDDEVAAPPPPPKPAAANALPVHNEYEEPDVAIPEAVSVQPQAALRQAAPAAAAPAVAAAAARAAAHSGRQEGGSSRTARPTSFTSWVRNRGSGPQDAEPPAQVLRFQGLGLNPRLAVLLGACFQQSNVIIK